jgi:hypothetical protein
MGIVIMPWREATQRDLPLWNGCFSIVARGGGLF